MVDWAFHPSMVNKISTRNSLGHTWLNVTITPQSLCDLAGELNHKRGHMANTLFMLKCFLKQSFRSDQFGCFWKQLFFGVFWWNMRDNSGSSKLGKPHPTLKFSSDFPVIQKTTTFNNTNILFELKERRLEKNEPYIWIFRFASIIDEGTQKKLIFITSIIKNPKNIDCRLFERDKSWEDHINKISA